jgi:hypothetical protein
MVAAASSGKLTIMKNKGEIEALVLFFFFVLERLLIRIVVLERIRVRAKERARLRIANGLRWQSGREARKIL